jgi:hypothetical protein
MDASGTITVQHLAGLLLCEPNVIRQIAATLAIPLMAPSSTGARAVSIARSAIPAVLSELQLRAKPAGFMRPCEAQRLLGLAKLNGLVELARDGLLRFKLHSNYVFFSEEDVRAILQKLQPDRLVRKNDGATRRLLYRNAHGGITISALLSARKNQKVILLGSPASSRGGLSGILLRMDDARALQSPLTDGMARGSISAPAIGTVQALIGKLRVLFPDASGAALPAVAWQTRLEAFPRSALQP